ncbi:uncharacterized protein LOC126682931 [Mercurialis annua]|uniref:uncharacterized protein LOC126682931 n=1 Tax=Mercurialis annua TaxID=3986 RepID=UPI00215F9CDA|nr:uncharacterized protein LOC126682931 [Mercurialis annua]
MTRFNGGYFNITAYYYSQISNNKQLQIFLNQHTPIMFLFIGFSLCLLSLSILFLYSINRRFQEQQKPTPKIDPVSFSKIIDGVSKASEISQTQLTRSLLLDILPSDSSKWVSLFEDEPGSGHGDESNDGSVGAGDLSVGNSRVKKKKRRAKKKRLDPFNEGKDVSLDREMEDSGSGSIRVKPELVCLYPFTSSSSATQRKIKQQYDQLVRCNESKGLTLAQVGDFANCLVEARNELQHKAESIKRKFTITKALLFKADRSSLDRLRQQIYKLELEQKRLEEDTFVYNWLQQQLKLSPAYKKMLEISACMEMKAKSSELMDDNDAEDSDISFEELLAQEKKDVFWQKNRKSRLH